MAIREGCGSDAAMGFSVGLGAGVVLIALIQYWRDLQWHDEQDRRSRKSQLAQWRAYSKGRSQTPSIRDYERRMDRAFRDAREAERFGYLDALDE